MDANAILNRLMLWMADNKWPLTAICVVGLIACLFFLFRDTGTKVKSSKKAKTTKHRIRGWFRKLYLGLMRAITTIPVLGDIAENLTYETQCHMAIGEEEAILHTGTTLFWAATSFIGFFAFGLIWFGDIILAMITAFIIAHIVFSSHKSDSRKFLTNLNDCVEDFLLAYHKSSGNIDLAMQAVIRSTNPEARHFRVMYDYIKAAFIADDPDSVQSQYNLIAPSRFLRSLYAVIYMTYKYGDQYSEGKSALNVNIIEIQEQIGDALYQQERLTNDTLGERWFILLPIYAIPLLETYMRRYFAFEGFGFIEAFLTSSAGYITAILCAVISLVCYLIYAQVVDRLVMEPKSKYNTERQLLRNAHMRNLVLRVLPLDSEKRAKRKDIIARSGTLSTANALQIRQFMLSIFLTIVAIISVTLNIWSNTNTINNDVYLGLPRENYTVILKTQDDMDVYISEMLAADKQAVNYFKQKDEYRMSDEDGQKEMIRNYLRESGLKAAYRNYDSYGVTRIHEKIEHLQKVNGLTNIIFVFVMALLGYWMPLWILQLRAAMNKSLLLMDEVNDLQKTTIMMMNYSTTTPDTLLQWYASSTSILAPYFRECKVTKDFKTLLNAVTYKPYIQLVTSLQMAFDGLPLKEAYSGVEQRLLTQKRARARTIEVMLKNRINTIELAANVSMGAVLALYMFMPLLVAMVQMFFSLGMFG